MTEQKQPWPQTYAEYLETMKAYGFYPLDYPLWYSWQVYYHGENAIADPDRVQTDYPE